MNLFKQALGNLTLIAAALFLVGSMPQGARTAHMTALVQDATVAVQAYADAGQLLSPGEARILVDEIHPLVAQVEACYAESDGFAYPENLRFTDDCARRLTGPLSKALSRLDEARPDTLVAETATDQDLAVESLG